MAMIYTTSADKASVSASGEPDPVTVEQLSDAVVDVGSRATTLEGKTDFANLVDAIDDAAAASAGVAVGELYRNGSVVQVRVA